MIAVDTSVWVAFFRGRDAALAEHLRELLDGDAVGLPVPVRIELLSGASKSNLPKLRRLLSAPPPLHPVESTWSLVESWAIEAALRGDRFGVGDLLIGAVAVEQRASVWSLDSDFARMEKLGWLHLHRPPRSS